MDIVYNHHYVRDIISNKKSIQHLTQNDVDLMFSHINLTPRKFLNGKIHYEAFEFLYGSKILEKLNKPLHLFNRTLEIFLIEYDT